MVRYVFLGKVAEILYLTLHLMTLKDELSSRHEI